MTNLADIDAVAGYFAETATHDVLAVRDRYGDPYLIWEDEDGTAWYQGCPEWEDEDGSSVTPNAGSLQNIPQYRWPLIVLEPAPEHVELIDDPQ